MSRRTTTTESARRCARTPTRRVIERLSSKPTLRETAALDAMRAWRTTIPSAFRLVGPSLERSKGGHFSIGEIRVSSGVYRLSHWDAPEWTDAIYVTELAISTSRRGVRVIAEVTSTVTSHALGRRHDRVLPSQRSIDALLEDLAPLAQPCAEIEQIRCSTGVWRGCPGVDRSKPKGQQEKEYWCADTFIANEMLHNSTERLPQCLALL